MMSPNSYPSHTNAPIALCGMMGSGKSAIGRRVALLLDRPFVDLDALIEERAEMSISRIFETEGEAAFRKWERDTLGQLLHSQANIIGLGGGSLQNQSVLQELKKTAFLCFIDTPLDVILERVQRNTNRPLLLNEKGDLKSETQILSFLQQLYEARLPLYEQAHVRYVPRPGNSIQDSAQELLGLLQQP